MSDKQILGLCEGDDCCRDGCAGKIRERKPENCSCHINPPCSACMAPRGYCDTCDWDEEDEPTPEIKPLSEEEQKRISAHLEEMDRARKAPLDNTKVSWRWATHSSCSMIKEGVYPQSGDESKDREMVRKEVNGTFGGRFEYFGGGRFKFIAYTD